MLGSRTVTQKSIDFCGKFDFFEGTWKEGRGWMKGKIIILIKPWYFFFFFF